MNKTLFWLLLSAPCFGAVNAPLTIREAIFPGSTPGVTRTNEPLTVGVPLPDSAGITSTNVLGLTGATAAQFSVEGRWPDGNIKWVKIRAIIPSLSAGGTTTITLTDSGSGNFGGSNLATDNGSTITVSTNGGTCGSGTAICFTVKKSHFNVIDQVQIGSTTVVASGASQGLVVLGPNPTAAYPGNVTCSPSTGGTACTTVYSTANDAANSTCSIEENGPAVASLNCQADLNDGSGHVYMHTTTRLYFFQGSSKVRATVSLRNADFGLDSSNFATAYKGIQAFELRLTPNLSGPLSYSIGAQTCTGGICGGTLNSSTDYAYVYQAEADWLQWGGDYINNNCPTTPTYNRCVKYSPLQGYAVMNQLNGTASTQATGTFSQYASGWADISNSSGVGVEIGHYQMAAYGNESLEFRSGGTDVRLGMWAGENNTTSTATLTPNAPYYMPYPEYSIHDVYLNFHTAAPASPANDFLKQQHYLVASASPSWYNSASVFYYPLEDPTEETSYYTTAQSAYAPAVTSSSVSPSQYQDLGAVNTYYWPLTAHKFYLWSGGGSSNQSELRLSEIFNFLRRGHTGEYLNAAHFYKLMAETGLPRADGFSWASEPGSNTNYYNYPDVTDNNKNQNNALGMKNWVGDDMEHAHLYGIVDYYLLSGDETYKDFIVSAYADTYLNTVSTNNMISHSGAPYTSTRSAGNNLMAISRLANFFASIGSSTTATSLMTRGNTIWTTMLKPNLCVQAAGSSDPSGCTPNLNATNIGSTTDHGTNFDRGVTYQFGDYSMVSSAGTCTFSGTGGEPRTMSPVIAGPLLQGLWEFRTQQGSSWSDYNAVLDYAFGMWQAMHGTSGMGGTSLGEMYVDNGATSWTGNGFRYKQWIDGANSCSTDYFTTNQGNFDAFWPGYWIEHQYVGQSQTNLQRQMTMMVESVMNGCGSGFEGSCAEIWHYGLGRLIYLLNHPNNYSLTTLTPTGFQDNGNGTYNITVNVPAGATSYRVKWGTRQLVDYIGYNAGTATWVGNPTTTQNWWSSTDATGIPAPTGGSQTITVGTNPSTPGLTAGNFMIKVYTGGSAPASTSPTTPPPATAPPAISLTAPAAGATVSGTTTVSANATAGNGVANVQFKLDGSNLGAAVTAAGPAYSTSWDTTTAAAGSHTLSAVVTDTTGATASSSTVSVTVNNATPAPTITNVTVSSITSSGSTITWTTSVAADSQVAYGTTAAYGTTTTLAASMVTSHSVSLSGLSPATTYHYQVLSHNAQGTLATSPDATFVTAAASTGTGTAIPTGTWTLITPGGYTAAEAMGFEKSAYISSRNISCYLGGYKEYTTSEANNAIVCYSYSENRWVVLQNSGYWASSHYGEAGHTQSAFAYDSDLDTIFYESDGAGASQPANGLYAHFWQHDVSGLSGREKEVASMPWMGANPAVSAFAYDSYDQKLLSWNAAKTLSVYDPVQNTWTVPSASGSVPSPSDLSVNLVFDPDNHTAYLYGGMMSGIYSVQCTTTACSAVTWTLLTTTCSGTSCNGTNPPVRTRAALAYSTTDHIFVMCAGENGAAGSGYTDTWTFDPSAKAWTQQATSATYSNLGNANTPYDKLTYDPGSNVFILIANPSGYSTAVYAFPYTPASNYGRVSNTYSVPSGSMNRNTSGNNQSWAFDPAVTLASGNLYTGWVETGVNSDNSTCGSAHHPQVQGTSGGLSWTGYGGCTALAPESGGSTDSSKLYLASIGGNVWEIHEESNSPAGYMSSAYAHYWNGTTWSGGQVGCFLGSCAYPASGAVRQFPAALIANGSTPLAAVIEVNANSYSREQYLYVAQYGSGSWSMLGSSFLNINPSGSGTRALSASLATDGTSPAACWSEEKVDPNSRAAIITHPQIRCARWNGSSWSGFGSSALNQSTSNWAYDPSVAYLGGSFYVAWVERTTNGNNLLYVCQWTGTACTLVGGGSLNINATTGWAAHPSLVSDGTSLYVGWEEQANLNQPSLGYVKQWNGSAWTQLGGTLAADPVNGSSEGLALAAANGTPTAVWGELSYGNLRQIYGKQWNGSTWTSINGSITISTTSSTVAPSAPSTPANACDLNGDGVVNAADVQLAINQALGIAACTNAALQTPGVCNVVDVQRVINASLGGACLTGN